MEVPGGSKNKFFVLLSELLGTAFLMIAINWGSTSDETARCASLMLFMII